MLAQLATQIWIVPSVPDDLLDKYQKQEEEPSPYTLDDFSVEGDMLELFHPLRQRVLNLDSSVKEEFKKYYIAYKSVTNFVDIVPQKRRLRLALNMKFEEIHDPRGACRDVTDVGRWGNGDVEFGVSSHDDIEYAMFLIRQAFEKRREDSGD